MSTAKFDTWQDSSGTNEFYKCRAWVNFNGTGTVAIRESGNVDSITDDGTGLYTVNLTNATADTNSSVVVGAQRAAAQRNNTSYNGRQSTTTAIQLSSFIISTTSAADSEFVCAALFR